MVRKGILNQLQMNTNPLTRAFGLRRPWEGLERALFFSRF